MDGVRGAPAPRRRTRDRHGRGLRGPLLPAGLPAALTRADAFDDAVLDSFERLLPRWGSALGGVEVGVRDVPADGAPADPAADPVPLAVSEPAAAGRPARIVVHRLPVLRRTASAAERDDLLDDVLVEAVADLLGLTPEQVDPRYGEGGRR